MKFTNRNYHTYRFKRYKKVRINASFFFHALSHLAYSDSEVTLKLYIYIFGTSYYRSEEMYFYRFQASHLLFH